MNDDNDDYFETLYITPASSGVITITDDAYDLLQRSGAMEERERILAWLRSDHHVMTHTAWALAKQIENEEHWK